MSNSYYNHGSFPAPNAPGSSAALRAELELITSGFDKLPALTGNANKVIVVNSTAGALTATTALSGLAVTSSTVNSTPIGGTTPAAGAFTTLSASGGITGALTGSVTGNVTGNLTGNVTGNITSTGSSSFSNATITGGTINGSVIGGSSAQAITGTLITASTGLVGPLTGNVTGNVTGNLTGNVTGNLTGSVTGNVTASSGTSSFNNVTIHGQLDMDGATSATIVNLSTPTSSGDAATKGYVDTADALKLNLSGGTMSGAIAMGTSKITGLGTPTAGTDAATKSYVDTADALKLNLAGGTLSGNLVMGGNLVTGLGTPSGSTDAATKGYVDTSVANLIDSAPGALDTLNELAAALGDDANFSTTITNSLATKLNLSGGTMTGAIAMGSNKVSGLADPTVAQDAATKAYVDTADATKLSLAGGSMTGAIAMGTSKITGLGDPTSAQDAATKTYVDTADAAKLNLAGGTMTGAIAMGTSKITGLGDPTNTQDAATKNYVDTQDATKLDLSGGTLSGNLAMGGNLITGLADPTAAQGAATKNYIDVLFGSTTDAATSAADASVSESNAATSASNAASSASAAASSASAAASSASDAAASLDEFTDLYLGSKSSAPTLDNDGNTLQTGALYFNTVSDTMFVWNGSSWAAAGSAINGTTQRNLYTATSGQTTFSATYDVGYVDVYLNGVKLIAGTDFTATDGNSVVLSSGAGAGDVLDIVGYGAFELTSVYTQTQSDARYLQASNNLSDLASASAARTSLGLATVASSGSYNDLSDTPSYATVASTGSYTDLTNKPTLFTTGKAIAMAIVFGG